MSSDWANKRLQYDVLASDSAAPEAMRYAWQGFYDIAGRLNHSFLYGVMAFS